MLRRLWLSTLIAVALAAAMTGALAQPRHRWNFSADNVPGWTLMNVQERTEHINRMQSMKTYEECVAYQNQHRLLLEKRAAEQGKKLTPPRRNACGELKARGFIK